MKRPLPNLLVQGFRLAVRNWPCVVWAYAVNLIFALLAGVPFSAGLGSYLDHSLAAQRIAGTLDISYLSQLAIHLRDTGFFPTVLTTAAWLNLFHFVALFFLFAGTVFIFVSAEPPRLSVLLRGGVAYFWRFVRAAILSGGIAAIIVAILLASLAPLCCLERNQPGLCRARDVSLLRSAVCNRSPARRRAWCVSGGIWSRSTSCAMPWMASAGCARRCCRRSGLLGKLFLPHRVGSFLLSWPGWESVPSPSAYSLWRAVCPRASSLARLFSGPAWALSPCWLAGFWQRGIEATRWSCMPTDPPHGGRGRDCLGRRWPDPWSRKICRSQPVPNVDVFAGLSEPTLRELVQKLRTEPWATPDAPTAAGTSRFDPSLDAAPARSAAPLRHQTRRTGQRAICSRLLRPACNKISPGRFVSSGEGSGRREGEFAHGDPDRHTIKFPLGGISPERAVVPIRSRIKTRPAIPRHLPVMESPDQKDDREDAPAAITLEPV